MTVNLSTISSVMQVRDSIAFTILNKGNVPISYVILTQHNANPHVVPVIERFPKIYMYVRC